MTETVQQDACLILRAHISPLLNSFAQSSKHLPKSESGAYGTEPGNLPGFDRLHISVPTRGVQGHSASARSSGQPNTSQTESSPRMLSS